MDPENRLDQEPQRDPESFHGVPTIDAKQAKPLFKLMNQMLRPRPKVRTTRWKKKVKYY